MKLSKKIVLLITLLTFYTGLIYVKADSGWDSSYDSGGWDSDWGSSSWDDDYSWGSGSHSYSSGNYSDDGLAGLMFMIIIVIIIIIIISNRNKPNSNNKNNNYGVSNNYKDMDVDKILSVDPDINVSEFKINSFNIYKNLQEAWMNFDNDKIRELTTDELYNMYVSQLETLKLKKQKNIMSNITSDEIKIVNARYDELNKVVSIDVYLKVRCLDYVINENTKQVVRGTKDRKLIIEYILTFVKSSDNKIEEKCPNCGAPIKMNSSKTCPYCESTLVKVSGKYVMSKKKCVVQSFDRR